MQEQVANLALTGTFQNIELAIVHAIHILAPFSKYGDESCRCKDIYKLVRDASVQVYGILQCGNHRFSIFSSALCGRRSAARLFLRISDAGRSGSWWKLRIPFDEAVAFAWSLQGPSRPDTDAADFDALRIDKANAIRSRFYSLISLSLMRSELLEDGEALADHRSVLEERCRGVPALAELQALRARIRGDAHDRR
jgi:hypothetical protein